MKRIAQKAWQAYHNLMGISLIGLALSASWAAVGTANLWLRLVPLATLLAFFIVCLAWAAWRVSIVREIKISRQARVLEFSRQATLHIASNGDLTISRTLSVANQGDRAVSGTIDEKMGFELDKLPSNDWAPDWEVVAVPVGKEVSKTYTYSFDEEKPLIPGTVGRIRTLCWGVQIRPYLDEGEKAAIRYSLPKIEGAEVKAFSDEGSHISLVPTRLYSRVSFTVHGPPGFCFEILELRVLSPDDQRDRAEEKWLATWHPAKVDADDDGLLRWNIEWPLPRYKYSTRYRLRSLASSANPGDRANG